jgi:hypothetical protein
LSSGRGRRLGLLGALVAAVALSVLTGVASAGGPPSLAFTPPSWDYGGVGQTSSQEFTLTNSGGSSSAALTVSLIGSPAFTISNDACTGTALGPRKSCSVTVAYTPASLCARDSATLTATGKKEGATASAALTGAGTGADIQGGLTSIAADGKSFVVAVGVSDTTIDVDAHTTYGGVGDPRSLADFNPGDTVGVCAAKQADGSLLAASVTRLPSQ